MKKQLILLTLIVLSITTHAQYTKMLDFAGASNGSYPWADFLSDGTFLYGTTAGGGTSGLGTIFKIKPDGTGYVKLLDFTGALNGRQPRGNLIYDGIFLYGMTLQGGVNDMGVIFKIKPDGTGYVKLLDFAGTSNGNLPAGSLITDGTFLYGMTYYGGTNDLGVVFKIKPDGSGYAKLLDFAGSLNGSNPYGSLITDGTFLYGMTYYGGTSGLGVVFKIKPDGTGFSKLLDFSGSSNGSNPIGSLISDGTFLYGMTSTGGFSNYGVIFKIKPDGTGFSGLLDFDNASGDQPNGSLVYDGTYLYGMTRLGGANSLGVIFHIKPDGTGYATLHDFDGPNGREPFGSLITDGSFLYGMAYQGGTSNLGLMFKYGLTTGIEENKQAGRLNIFPNPFSTQTTLHIEERLQNASFTVYNSVGQTVAQIKNISGQTITFNRDNLPSGLYFVRLTEDNKVYTDKVIITDK